MEHKLFYSFIFSLCHLISARSGKYSICVKWVDKQENELGRKEVTMSECAEWAPVLPTCANTHVHSGQDTGCVQAPLSSSVTQIWLSRLLQVPVQITWQGKHWTNWKTLETQSILVSHWHIKGTCAAGEAESHSQATMLAPNCPVRARLCTHLLTRQKTSHKWWGQNP